MKCQRDCSVSGCRLTCTVPVEHETSLSSARSASLRTTEAAAISIRTFFRIAAEWDLTVQDLQALLRVGRTTFLRWQQGRYEAGLTPAVLERLSHVFGIYKSLQILLAVRERSNAWIRQPNDGPLFKG